MALHKFQYSDILSIWKPNNNTFFTIGQFTLSVLINMIDPMAAKRMQEGEDFYFNDEGLMVLTKEFLLKRGFCCQSGCENCPYGIKNRIDPTLPIEYQTCMEDQSHYEYDDDGDED